MRPDLALPGERQEVAAEAPAQSPSEVNRERQEKKTERQKEWTLYSTFAVTTKTKLSGMT